MCVNELQKPCALFVDVRMMAKEQWQVAATSNSFVSFFFDFNFFISVLLSSKIKISVLSTCSYENRYFKDFSEVTTINFFLLLHTHFKSCDEFWGTIVKIMYLFMSVEFTERIMFCVLGQHCVKCNVCVGNIFI